MSVDHIAPDGQRTDIKSTMFTTAAAEKEGYVNFIPKSATLYLIAAHYTAEDEKSDEYEATSYASTITLHVPNQAPLTAR